MVKRARPKQPATHGARGFTMIELIVVMAVIGLLLSIAAPRYLDSLERGKHRVAAHDLAQMQKAIDQFYGDRGAYPEQLQDLVTYRYLRALPPNPFTGAVDWLVVPPPAGRKGKVYDVTLGGSAPTGGGALEGTEVDQQTAPAAAQRDQE